LVDRNHLLHKAVRTSNENLYKYLLNFNVNVNSLDEYQCSPLFYGVSLKDKKAILYLSKKGGSVICPTDELFEMLVKELKTDNLSFFELLYHIEFKETLRQETNNEGRNVLHISAILGADKCLKYILEKFKFNVKSKDNYGKMYIDYLRNN
jgi:ankyrin repeat protein